MLLCNVYVPVRGGRFRRWLNLRKLGGVVFAPYLACAVVEVLGQLVGVSLISCLV